MPKKEKIEELKLSLGINDIKLAEIYLIRVNWDVEEAIKQYEFENPNCSERDNVQNETQNITEFDESEILKNSNENFLPKNKDLYVDFIKFLKNKFPNTVSNFKDFLI